MIHLTVMFSTEISPDTIWSIPALNWRDLVYSILWWYEMNVALSTLQCLPHYVVELTMCTNHTCHMRLLTVQLRFSCVLLFSIQWFKGHSWPILNASSLCISPVPASAAHLSWRWWLHCVLKWKHIQHITQLKHEAHSYLSTEIYVDCIYLLIGQSVRRKDRYISLITVWKLVTLWGINLPLGFSFKFQGQEMNNWVSVLSKGQSQIQDLQNAYACFQINLSVILYKHLTV